MMMMMMVVDLENPVEIVIFIGDLGTDVKEADKEKRKETRPTLENSEIKRKQHVGS